MPKLKTNRSVKKRMRTTKSGRIKRLVDISISRKGLELLEQLDIRNADMDNIMCNLTNEEAIQLSSLLDKVRER